MDIVKIRLTIFAGLFICGCGYILYKYVTRHRGATKKGGGFTAKDLTKWNDKVVKISRLLNVHSFVVTPAIEETPLECIKDYSEARKDFINSLDKNHSNQSVFTDRQKIVFMRWVEKCRTPEQVIEAYNKVYSKDLQNVAIRKLYKLI